MSATKLCKNCRHVAAGFCGRRDAEPDLVLGGTLPEYVSCYTERTIGVGNCGPDARFWQPRPWWKRWLP